MRTQLLVRWPNAGHRLLENPKVAVTADGADLSPVSADGVGRFLFDVPVGTARVGLRVEFEPTLPVPGAGDTSFHVFAAEQNYEVEGTTLRADLTPTELLSGATDVQMVSPLIDSVSHGDAWSGLTVAEVRTEFVDVTALWRSICDPVDVEEHDLEIEPEADFVALGATGSRPSLWLATFARGLQPPQPSVGAFVFLRPALAYSYHEPWDAVHRADGQNVLNRYLLSPRNLDEPFFQGGRQVPRPRHACFQIIDGNYPYPRVGFGRSVSRSGKPVVLLQPWPEQAGQFLDATTARLPELANAAIRALRGLGHIALNHQKAQLGRLGLGGISFSGPAFVRSLEANRQAVREVYLFDPRGMPDGAPRIIQWAANTPDFRLRMTGGLYAGSMLGIYRSVKQAVGEQGLSVYPKDLPFWAPVAQGGSRWFEYMTALVPSFRTFWNGFHQFAICGGEHMEWADGPGAPNAPPRAVDHTHFLEQFLRESGY